ncbi:MAG: hypothetical protein LC667_01345 [Thioalkalivibrio sp.]|nr:hypothetical protein [Thioalkalivibrio sp.]
MDRERDPVRRSDLCRWLLEMDPAREEDHFKISGLKPTGTIPVDLF